MSKEDGKALLENAYQLQSPDDNIAYYSKLAQSYDEDFAEGLGYALPEAVAKCYRAMCIEADAPVLDVGCGTGLLATELVNTNLSISDLSIDGLDISEAMLNIAQTKNHYRNLYCADLTKPISTEIKNYGAVLSCGTFTHGHLGPDAMVRLLEVAKDNALFVLSVNKEHYASHGFEKTTETLLVQNQIKDLNTQELNIYNASGHEHSHDLGILLSFRKNG